MRRNETLVHLAGIMKKCNELNLPCKRAIDHYGSCIKEMADDVIVVVNKLLEKPEIRSCRMPLVIDFDKMTKEDYWMDCKIFSELPPMQSEALRQKFSRLVDMLRSLQMKILEVDVDYAEQFFKRMAARLEKSTHNLEYEIWRKRHPHPTMKQLEHQQIQQTANMLIAGILEYDEDPAGDDVAEVKLELVRRGLKHGQQLPDNFDVECAKLRRYSYWKGEHLFMIDYQQIYTYLFSHCFEKFTKEQRIALYEYDVQLKMIHEDMARLKPELGKYLYSSKKLVSLENTKLFAPFFHIKEMLKGEWFRKLRIDTKYDDKWADAFAAALMRSEYGCQIADEWKEKANQVKGYVIGCLKEAGVFMPDISNDCIASETGIMKNKRTFGKYIGKESQEQPYAEWILKHVNDYC
jgi:hypothetical protein